MGIGETSDMVTSSPANIRIENRQKKNRRIWGSKAWKIAKQHFLIKNDHCEWCDAYSELPHHPTDEYYGKDEYIDLHLNGCVALCRKCHFALHKGLILCKECKHNYHTTQYEMCFNCDIDRQKQTQDNKRQLDELKRKIQDEQNALRRRIYKERKEMK
jgi:hypothetical protein